MKKILFSLAFALLLVHGFGQNLDSAAVVREVDSLIKVSRTFTAQRDYTAALEINSKAEKIAIENLGRESVAYGSCCFNRGRVLYFRREYPEAEKWYLESKAIREKNLGRENPDYAWSLNNLGLLYYDLGKYEKAEPLYLESKAVREKTLGKEHPDYAASLTNLAGLYWSIGQYEKVEPLSLEAVTIWEKTMGKEHPLYAASLENLAILYKSMGQYEKSEPLHIESKAIREKTLGKEHPAYASSLTNLGTLYEVMGQYEKAESLHMEAKTINEKTLGKEHPAYAASLTNLGTLYHAMGQYEKAEPLYMEVKTIHEKNLGKEHPNYARSIENLANLYREMGQYEKAKLLSIEAKTIKEKVLGKEHPEYAANLHNLALLYQNMGQYEKAELLQIEVNDVWGKILGKEYLYYVQGLNNLALLYQYMGQYEKAVPLYVELSALNQTLLEKAVRHLSEHELGRYLNKFRKGRDQTFSLAQRFGGKKGTSVCYDNSLFYKGFLLHALGQIKRLPLSDSVAAEKFNLFKSYNRRLAAEYSKPIIERKNVADLEEKANAIEKELIRTVAGFGEALRQVNWQEVQSSLKSGEVAIEFVHFKYSTPKPTDSTLYAALLLRPDWPQPRMVGLFEEKAIQPLLNAANASAAADQLYAARGGKKRDQTKKSEGIVVGIGETANLYQLVWQPLDSLMQGAKTIYFSPSGLLHRLNLGAIPIPGSNQILADRYRLVQVGSTRQLVVGSRSSSKAQTAALFGALKFDAPTTPDQDTATATATYDALSLRRSLGARGRDNWSYLPGTEKEIRNIAGTLNKAGFFVQSSTGYDGTEAAFKTLGANNAPSPAVLHIATHGFFFPDPKDTVNSASFIVDREPVFKTSDNPLMRSGLILTGANHAWAGGKTPEGQEDGILTAYEISQLNLSNTELVVLSACETGLGDVEGNEGVYGLQRAFKIAGAKYLIMSLWQVPDKETSEFMSSFYKKWLEEKIEIPEAFRAAQKEMREQGFDPYQWAGFVLVE